MGCRLIALDKCPGVWSIRIGNTARCLIANAVLSIAKMDIQEAAGSLHYAQASCLAAMRHFTLCGRAFQSGDARWLY